LKVTKSYQRHAHSLAAARSAARSCPLACVKWREGKSLRLAHTGERRKEKGKRLESGKI
jgi:hypothetical protein